MSKSPKKRKRIEISDDEDEPAEMPTPGQKRMDSSSDEENQCQNTPKIKRDQKPGISCTSGQGGSGRKRRSGSSLKSPVKLPTPSSTRAKKMVMFQGTYYSDDYYGDKEDALDAEEAEEMDDFIVNDEEESAGEEGATSDEEQYEEQSESDDEIEEVPKTGIGCSKKIITIDEDEDEEDKQIKIGKGKNKGKQKGKETIQNKETNLPVRRSRRIQGNMAQKELNEDMLKSKIKGRRQKVKTHTVNEGNEKDDDEEDEELADEEEDEEEDEGEIIHEKQDRTVKNKDNSPVRRSQRIRGKTVEKELNDEWFKGKLVERRQKAIPMEEENDEEDLDDEEEEIVYDEEEDEEEPTELPIRQGHGQQKGKTNVPEEEDDEIIILN